MTSLIKIMKNRMSEYNVAIDAINYLLVIYLKRTLPLIPYKIKIHYN